MPPSRIARRHALDRAETLSRGIYNQRPKKKKETTSDRDQRETKLDQVRSGGNLSIAKRRFRILKREKNIPVLGVCESCNAEFTADPGTIVRPQDAHAFIQKQFIVHKCKRLHASQYGVHSVSKCTGITLSTSPVWGA